MSKFCHLHEVGRYLRKTIMIKAILLAIRQPSMVERRLRRLRSDPED